MMSMAGVTRPGPPMRIEITRACYLNGEAQPVGTVIEVPDLLARELIHNGKATVVAEPQKSAGRRKAADPVD